MESSKLKNYLIRIAEKLTPESTMEDVYEQLALLSDIDASEENERKGEILTQNEVERISKSWLK
ncbi:MAG: hypothetical protein ABR572_11025 [Cryomorphaceae bacterium]